MRQFLLACFTFGLILCSQTSCTPTETDVEDPDTGGGDPTDTYALGWLGTDNLSTVPESTNFGFGSNGNLPPSFDITTKFPPIGDQGQYGTCVAWACGYNLKSALTGINKGLSSSDLASPSNQFSPKDLFLAMPQKGANCNGSNFETALQSMQDRGIATLASVPYTQLGDCSSSPEQSWTDEASNYKIKYWRKIDASVNSIKENISNNVPIVFGARLADNFMSWNSDEVISSHSSFQNVGQHAYHALILAGYDDNRGSNGAFRVINSWGSNWGDRGYIWVDYNFFLNTFAKIGSDSPLFIAANQDGTVTPPKDDEVNPNAGGVDLSTWVLSDESTSSQTGSSTSRSINYNIYNIGSAPAKATDNWSVYYIYFNAYNADDYGILFYDEFNTTVDQGSVSCPESNHCIINADIQAGDDLAYQVYGNSFAKKDYEMPNITGEYYLVMIADGKDKFKEQDEQDNLFYTTLDPIKFTNGSGFKAGGSSNFVFKNKEKYTSKNKVYQDTNKKKFKNAYTAEEVKAFFNKEINSDRFKSKVVNPSGKEIGANK